MKKKTKPNNVTKDITQNTKPSVAPTTQQSLVNSGVSVR